MNGDGIPDLVMVEYNGVPTNAVYWEQTALGKGDGTFTLLPPAILSLVATAFVNVVDAVGDFNGDGKTDLVLAGYAPGTASNYLWFLPWNGDGTFGPPAVAYQVPNPSIPLCTTRMAAADFNQDDNLDLACPNAGDGSSRGNVNSPPGAITVLVGDGHGSFNLESNIPVGFSPQSIVVADFNGDGKGDMAAASWYYVTPIDIVTTVAVRWEMEMGPLPPPHRFLFRSMTRPSLWRGISMETATRILPRRRLLWAAAQRRLPLISAMETAHSLRTL